MSWPKIMPRCSFYLRLSQLSNDPNRFHISNWMTHPFSNLQGRQLLACGHERWITTKSRSVDVSFYSRQLHEQEHGKSSARQATKSLAENRISDKRRNNGGHSSNSKRRGTSDSSVDQQSRRNEVSKPDKLSTRHRLPREPFFPRRNGLHLTGKRRNPSVKRNGSFSGRQSRLLTRDRVNMLIDNIGSFGATNNNSPLNIKHGTSRRQRLSEHESRGHDASWRKERRQKSDSRPQKIKEQISLSKQEENPVRRNRSNVASHFSDSIGPFTSSNDNKPFRRKLEKSRNVDESRREEQNQWRTPSSLEKLKNVISHTGKEERSSVKNRSNHATRLPGVESKQTFPISLDRLDLFVSCLPGLEPVLSSELAALKIDHLMESGGATLVSPTLSELFDCHLYLGSASHVLLRCGEPFSAHGLAELRRKVSKTEWGSLLEENVQLDVRVSSYKSSLYHTGAIAERVKVGILESLGRAVPQDDADNVDGSQNAIGDDAVVVPLTVRVNRDMVYISIDTSTTPLHQRGYRLQTAKAPLREDLAYAMLYSAGWQPMHSRQSYQSINSGRLYSAVLDPFCGSGTIAIEAAAIALGNPPGRLRTAPMEGTILHDPLKWDALVRDAMLKERRGESLDFSVSASDRDAGAVQAAIGNAKRAGVQDYIDIHEEALSSSNWFANITSAPDSLLVATNPPFGKRVAPIRNYVAGINNHPLLRLYQKVGHQIKQLMEARETVGAVILAQDIRLARKTALQNFQVAFTSHHGGLPVSAMVLGRLGINET